MSVKGRIEAGPRANQKRNRDQIAWDCRDGTGGGGSGGSGAEEDARAREGEVVLTFDERKRARTDHGHPS